jgi:hypothetical protein
MNANSQNQESVSAIQLEGFLGVPSIQLMVA